MYTEILNQFHFSDRIIRWASFKNTGIFKENITGWCFWGRESIKKYIFWFLYKSNGQPTPTNNGDRAIWRSHVKPQNYLSFQGKPCLPLNSLWITMVKSEMSFGIYALCHINEAPDMSSCSIRTNSSGKWSISYLQSRGQPQRSQKWKIKKIVGGLRTGPHFRKEYQGFLHEVRNDHDIESVS